VSPPADLPTRTRGQTWLLLVTVLIIATCGIVYELLASTVSSYLLGDSVTQFSLVTGVYLSALGLGSYLSRFVVRDLARAFVEVEIALALTGGLSAPVLFLAYAHTSIFAVVLYGTVVLVGTLVGLELPLLIRLLKEQVTFEELLSRALTFDYLGALVGSLVFSLLVVPRLGLVRTSLVFGMVNALVAIGSARVLAGRGRSRRPLQVRALLVAALLGVAFSQASRLTKWSEESIYGDEIVFAEQTPYQRIVVARASHSFQLFLNGGLQFSSADEYRYHEALVHPAFALAETHARVLVVGGGDGLAAREILRYPDVQAVTLVDIDPAMTRISRSFGPLVELNRGSFLDPKITVVNDDAMTWLARAQESFDVLVVDFPDPTSFSVGKLYTEAFYRLARRHLAPGGVMVVQATSPLFARTSFWCILHTIAGAGFAVRPYHAPVPSFGEWGWVLARAEPFDPPTHVRLPGLRFLDDVTLTSLFAMTADMSEVPAERNQLDNQVLVGYHEHDWKKWD
jgi:spermidine synthase